MSFVKITIIDRERTPHQIEAPTDMSLNLMEICKAYELPVDGTCGGMALCASCHVYVRSPHDLPERSEVEEGSLDQSFHMDDICSRLGCQIPIHSEIDGLVVELAPDE